MTELCLTLMQIIRVATGQINGVADSGVLLNYNLAISDKFKFLSGADEFSHSKFIHSIFFFDREPFRRRHPLGNNS